MMLVSLILLVILAGSVQAAREEDRVTYLPGLDPQPDFNHYAGYLDVDGNKKFFYWFVESENDPANDPVVLWLNGGPGCSSLTGFLVELGPWRVDPSGEYLHWFEHRWNKIANIIFLESPQCVGYSYAEDGDCTSSDDQTAYDNHMALLDFFEGFPEFQDNEFFVTGESYAGVYVPTLSVRLLDDDNINFEGMAIGNGVTDNDIMDNALVHLTWARGLYGRTLWEEMLLECCDDFNSAECDFASSDNTLACRLLMVEVNLIVWASGLNPYGLYDECYGGAPGPDAGPGPNGVMHETDTSLKIIHPGSVPLIGKQAREDYYNYWVEKIDSHAEDDDVETTIPCTDTSDRETYLNKPEVREALHVHENVTEWLACSSTLRYNRQYDAMQAEYLRVIEAGKRVLVFNGDLDLACNSLGDMWFVEGLNQPVKQPYKYWYYDEDEEGEVWQIAGWVSQYQNLDYVQVKGAGHFVPTDKPWPAFIMWENFIYDRDY